MIACPRCQKLPRTRAEWHCNSKTCNWYKCPGCPGLADPVKNDEVVFDLKGQSFEQSFPPI